jgi:hypothetical protein
MCTFNETGVLNSLYMFLSSYYLCFRIPSIIRQLYPICHINEKTTPQYITQFLFVLPKCVRLKRENSRRLALVIVVQPSSFKIEALIWISFWRALKFQPFSGRVDSNPRRQSKNIEMTYKKLILNLCMNYMVYVSSTILKIKNQLSHSTSCSDKTLHLLVLVVGRLYWGLQVPSSFSICGCILS